MPNFDSYEKDGRKLLVRFTCYRCKKAITTDLEPLDKKEVEHYGKLALLPIPEGWSDWLIHSRLLCDACTTALNDFFKCKGEEEKP